MPVEFVACAPGGEDRIEWDEQALHCRHGSHRVGAVCFQGGSINVAASGNKALVESAGDAPISV